MDLTKNKKRAMRRKRNMIAKSLEEKQFRPKVITKGPKRTKISVKEIEEFLAEESETGPLESSCECGRDGGDQRRCELCRLTPVRE